MATISTGTDESRWLALSRSRAAQHHPATAAFFALMGALETGWQVEPPVYVRPDWSKSAEGHSAYHFVLQNRAARLTTLLSVPDCPEVQRLLDEQGWEISARSWGAAMKRPVLMLSTGNPAQV